MSGKKEFSTFIKHCNENSVQLSANVKQAIKTLINRWNGKPKTLDDFMDMKEDHTIINTYFHDKESTASELWMKYIKTAIEYRVNLMAYEYSLLDDFQKNVVQQHPTLLNSYSRHRHAIKPDKCDFCSNETEELSFEIRDKNTWCCRDCINSTVLS